MFRKPKSIPVLVAGLWPATEGAPKSGARVYIHEGIGKAPMTPLLQGHADTNGQFRGRLPGKFAGKTVRIAIVEPGFLIDDYHAIEVNRWGLFLAVKLMKDTIYNGSKGAKSIDPDRWHKWNASREHAEASRTTHAAARTAKLTVPLDAVGLVIGVLLAVGGYFFNPIAATVAGVAVAGVSFFLPGYLLTKGY